jgi:hypothetical protein
VARLPRDVDASPCTCHRRSARSYPPVPRSARDKNGRTRGIWCQDSHIHRHPCTDRLSASRGTPCPELSDPHRDTRSAKRGRSSFFVLPAPPRVLLDRPTRSGPSRPPRPLANRCPCRLKTGTACNKQPTPVAWRMQGRLQATHRYRLPLFTFQPSQETDHSDRLIADHRELEIPGRPSIQRIPRLTPSSRCLLEHFEFATSNPLWRTSSRPSPLSDSRFSLSCRRGSPTIGLHHSFVIRISTRHGGALGVAGHSSFIGPAGAHPRRRDLDTGHCTPLLARFPVQRGAPLCYPGTKASGDAARGPVANRPAPASPCSQVLFDNRTQPIGPSLADGGPETRLNVGNRKLNRAKRTHAQNPRVL